MYLPQGLDLAESEKPIRFNNSIPSKVSTFNPALSELCIPVSDLQLPAIALEQISNFPQPSPPLHPDPVHILRIDGTVDSFPFRVSVIVC
jgi:hypothetical protein